MVIMSLDSDLQPGDKLRIYITHTSRFFFMPVLLYNVHATNCFGLYVLELFQHTDCILSCRLFKKTPPASSATTM